MKIKNKIKKINNLERRKNQAIINLFLQFILGNTEKKKEALKEYEKAKDEYEKGLFNFCSIIHSTILKEK